MIFKIVYSLFFILLLINCQSKKQNDVIKSYFKEENGVKREFFLSNNDTVRIRSYYKTPNNELYSEIKAFLDYDSLTYFYKNGNVYKSGIVDKNGLKKGIWKRYTNDSYLSDIREYMIINNESIINRKFYLTKKGDTAWYAKKFNSYKQKEFVDDTLSSRNSNMTLFNIQSEDTISINEPFAAYVSHFTPLLRSKNSEIVMYLGKEGDNFNYNFSNEDQVKLDTFPNLKLDTTNKINFERSGHEEQYTAVFGRWFKTPGEKILRGYMKEFFERDPTEDDSIIKGEHRVYFEKKIFVKDTVSVIDFSKPKKKDLIALN